MAYYHVTLIASNQNQQIVNTFDYVTTSLLGASDEAQALNTEFIENVLPPIKAIMHTAWVAERLYTICTYSPDVFASVIFGPGTQIGLRTGEQMPRFVAWGYKCGRLRRDIKDGAKRFSPISEADQLGGVPTSPMLLALNNCSTAMKAQLTLEYAGGTSGAVPAIIKRSRQSKPGGGYSYHLPSGMEPLIYYEASQWVFDEITTQNTRKTGRGA